MATSNWIKSDGSTQALDTLATTHLFYTLRLVWNSMMPRPLSVGTFKSVLFRPDLYTSEYWRKCLPAMFEELHSRTNLPERYKEQLANIQLPALLDRIGTEEDLAKAILDFLNREDTEYAPEEKSWDSINSDVDLTRSRHTLKQGLNHTFCPRCHHKFEGKYYFEKAGRTCPVCTSQYDYN